VYTVITKRALQ